MYSPMPRIRATSIGRRGKRRPTRHGAAVGAHPVVKLHLELASTAADSHFDAQLTGEIHGAARPHRGKPTPLRDQHAGEAQGALLDRHKARRTATHDTVVDHVPLGLVGTVESEERDGRGHGQGVYGGALRPGGRAEYQPQDRQEQEE